MSSIPLKDYLKKYMSQDEPQKKKKKKMIAKHRKLSIHDEDEIVAPAYNEDFPLDDDDDPQIVDIDEIGPLPDPSNWKSLSQDPPPDIKQEVVIVDTVKEEIAETAPKRRRFGDDDMSPVRRIKEETEITSSRPTQVTVRDRKTLKKKDMEVEKAKEEEKKKWDEKVKEKYNLWGLGIKQVEDRLKENKSHRREVKKPLSRSIEDSDLNKHLKKRLLEEDPMLKFMGEETEDNSETKLMYENRYGIAPGVRWDGVDRSNGYERRFLQNMADKVAIKAVAYRIRTDDM